MQYIAQLLIKQYNLNAIVTKLMQSPSPRPKHSFDVMTEDSEIKAPRPKPMQSQQLPPEFKLQDSMISSQTMQKLSLGKQEKFYIKRRGSLDNHYSILAFIDRRIKEKSRQRIMSEDLHNLRL